jgi:hypothetical protein
LLVLLSTKDVLLVSYFFLFTALAALVALQISETDEEEDKVSNMEEDCPQYCNRSPARLVTAESMEPGVGWGKIKHPKQDPVTLFGWGLRFRHTYGSKNRVPAAGERVKDVPAGKRVVPTWKDGRYAGASRRGASDGPFQTLSKQQSKRF